MTTNTPAPPTVEALVLDLKISADDWRDSAIEVARDDDEADVPRVNEMQGRAERLNDLAAALPGLMADAERWRELSRGELAEATQRIWELTHPRVPTVNEAIAAARAAEAGR